MRLLAHWHNMFENVMQDTNALLALVDFAGENHIQNRILFRI